MLAAVLPAHVVIAAALVDARFWKIVTLTQSVEDRAGPPMEMQINDVHGALLAKQPALQRILTAGTSPVNARWPRCVA